MVAAVHDRSRQSGEAFPDSQVVWRQLHHPLVCWHSLSPLVPPTRPRTHLLWQYSGGDSNLKFPNLQLNLTLDLCHSRPAVGKQSETGGATAIKKRFKFRHTEVQFRHAWESDNYPRSTEILQINQWAALLIPSGQRQIKCIIDLRNPSPSICNSSLKGWGWGCTKTHWLYSTISVFLFLPVLLSRLSPTWLACWLPGLRTGGVSWGRELWYISAGLDLAQAKDMAFFNQWSPGYAALSPPFSII